ncbi:MAG: hypothetical protein LWW97_09710 [Deltaproteobacteria bacterium]|nr:hypothetical protein [Deltaproteobacteria bacterium]
MIVLATSNAQERGFFSASANGLKESSIFLNLLRVKPDILVWPDIRLTATLEDAYLEQIRSTFFFAFLYDSSASE